MAEVNQCAPGLYALQSDYTALERKCQELERERDELASLRDTLTAELDRRFKRISVLETAVGKCQRNDVEVERLRKIEAAAIKLVKCKGRYHTEQNYNALAAALGDGRKG